VKSVLYSFALVLVALPVAGQGTLVVDQQSANRSDSHSSIAVANTGQSFTPTMSGIDFIQIAVADPSSPPSADQVFVNLRSGSITGAIIGTTGPVDMPNSTNIGPGFFSTCFFPATVPLTPGVQYFFQPVDTLNNNSVGIELGTFNYSGGQMYSGSSTLLDFDLWFTEGIVVPEPGTVAVLALGSGMMAWHVRRRRRGISGSV
jgi:hypothetical protein